MDLVIFILGTAAHTFVKWLDVKSSREMTTYGIKEFNPLFRDKNRMFVEWRAWVAIAALTAIAVFLFNVPALEYIPGEPLPDYEWHPLYALGVYALSGPLSVWMYFYNKGLIRRRKDEIARGVTRAPGEVGR